MPSLLYPQSLSAHLPAHNWWRKRIEEGKKRLLANGLKHYPLEAKDDFVKKMSTMECVCGHIVGPVVWDLSNGSRALETAQKRVSALWHTHAATGEES